MKIKSLVTILILIVCFVLAPGLLRAEENEWYQGQQGQWQKQGKNWQWRSTHGNQWYQGQQGSWYQQPRGWQWYSNNGDQYRQAHNSWGWYGNGPCANFQRLENQARLDRQSGHPAAAEDVEQQAAAARAKCYGR